MTDRNAIAADWLLRLREPEVREDTVAEWVAWCAADPRNRAAFDAMEQLWDLSGGLERPEPEAASEPVRLSAWRRHRTPVLGLGAALAASVALAVALNIAGPPLPAPAAIERLETERGKVQKATLADGSEVELGGRTALSVRYSAQTRLIIADEGEAFYKVRKNRERPFVVQAGPVTVTAVGTAFTVERADSAVAVLVTEGVVEVRTAPRGGSAPMVVRLAAGQKARFDRGELIQSTSAPTTGTDVTASWRTGRLDFKDEPLRLVVARINRYAARPVTLADPSIEDLRVTGTVWADRLDSWAEGIEAVLPVKASRREDGSLVLAPS